LPEIQAAIEQQIKGYRSYLQSLGYRPPATELKIRVDTSNRDEAFYDGKMIIVGANIVNEPEVIYRDYTERMLTETNKAAWVTADWKVTAILSGLADYFPCSFVGDPIFGAKYVQALGEKLPAEFGKRGYLRNLANNRSFVADSASPLELEMHTAGEVWGGVFWEIRGLLGCKDNTVGCVATDKIVLASWTALNLAPLGSVDVRLAQSVVKNVRESFGAELAGKVHEAFSRRGLVLGPP
jgi:hypothetical protein